MKMMSSPIPSSLKRFRRLIVDHLPTILIVAGLLVLIVRRAWMSDDAYITLRTVDNFINGYRLTWNTIERVQAYTHPLWMFLLSFFYFFTREPYYTTLIISIFLTLLAIILLSGLLKSSRRVIFISLLMLSLSNAFIDYATSGLENPLTYLLLVLFLWFYFRLPDNPRKVFVLSFIASWMGVNRLDTVLFCFLPVLFVLWRTRSFRSLIAGISGQIPLIIWEIFSLFYYGFPFPNTAYAKLNTGISSIDLMYQGGAYFLNLLIHDPLTFLVIVFCVVGLMVTQVKIIHPPYQKQMQLMVSPLMTAVIGIVLYLLYVIKIGGDFMSGRFFAPVFLYVVILLGRWDWFKHVLSSNVRLGAVVCVVLALGWLSPTPTITVADTGRAPVVDEHGIANERLWYNQDFGLLRVLRYGTAPGEDAKKRALSIREEAGDDLVVLVAGNTGVFGYYAGPHVFIIDKYALSDPLLARLPAKYVVDWRVGHFERVIPDGYISEIYRLGPISDSKLARYYQQLQILTQHRLTDLSRIREIWRMNTGFYATLINGDAYRYPDRLEISLAELNQLGDPVNDLMEEKNDADRINFSDSGVQVDLESILHASRIGICLESNDAYRIAYYNGENLLGYSVKEAYEGPAVLMCYFLQPPYKVSKVGYDVIRVLPLEGDGIYALGHIRLVE